MSNSLKHVAIIMDGNSRWARKKDLSIIDAYEYGAEKAKEIMDIAIKHKLKHLTFFAFSYENWNRPVDEIEAMLKLLDFYITNQGEAVRKKSIRLKFIGDFTKLGKDLTSKMESLMDSTKDNEELNLYLAFSYGGRQEIVNACKRIVESNIPASQIDEKLLRTFFYAPEMPDVDLLIRTGGERRISNFLLWHVAYSELFFSEKLWPEFDENEFITAKDFFYSRQRNFGHARK